MPKYLQSKILICLLMDVHVVILSVFMVIELDF